MSSPAESCHIRFYELILMQKNWCRIIYKPYTNRYSIFKRKVTENSASIKTHHVYRNNHFGPEFLQNLFQITVIMQAITEFAIIKNRRITAVIHGRSEFLLKEKIAIQ